MDLVVLMHPETCGRIETTCWDRQFPILPSHHTWTHHNKYTCTQHRMFLFLATGPQRVYKLLRLTSGWYQSSGPLSCLKELWCSLLRNAYEDVFAKVERGSCREVGGSTKESILYQKHLVPEETFMGTWHLTGFLKGICRKCWELLFLDCHDTPHSFNLLISMIFTLIVSSFPGIFASVFARRHTQTTG